MPSGDKKRNLLLIFAKWRQSKKPLPNIFCVFPLCRFMDVDCTSNDSGASDQPMDNLDNNNSPFQENLERKVATTSSENLS